MKKFTLLLFTAITFFIMTGCVRISSKEEYYDTEKVESDKSILFSIDCSDILDNMDKLDYGLKKYIPEYGLVIDDKEYPLKDGETAYDLLIRIARENKIHTESKGLFGNREIEGINFIYNSSCGKDSKWICKVNGKVCQPVFTDYELKDGDVVQWIFLCN